MKELEEMTNEELENYLQGIIDVCSDYYFNQYYIEKYENDPVFNETGIKLGEKQELIEAELKRRNNLV